MLKAHFIEDPADDRFVGLRDDGYVNMTKILFWIYIWKQKCSMHFSLLLSCQDKHNICNINVIVSSHLPKTC